MGQRRRLKIYNPEEISSVEIEMLIDRGYRFDIYDGLAEEDYDRVEGILNGEDAVCQDKL